MQYEQNCKKNKKIPLVRALSKLGVCSRNEAQKIILSGDVAVNGEVIFELTYKVNLISDKITVKGQLIKKPKFVYIMLNKPRGLVTTRSDEKSRPTVYECFKNFSVPYIFPVGRLDKASEGLLFFTNDTGWASKIIDPKNQIPRVYHVQINQLATEDLCEKLQNGILIGDSTLNAKNVSILRKGIKNSWLEITLLEGKNRHIRRLVNAFNIKVLRLVRVSFGGIKLGSLKKGCWRYLSDKEVKYLYNQCKKRI